MDDNEKEMKDKILNVMREIINFEDVVEKFLCASCSKYYYDTGYYISPGGVTYDNAKGLLESSILEGKSNIQNKYSFLVDNFKVNS